MKKSMQLFFKRLFDILVSLVLLLLLSFIFLFLFILVRIKLGSPVIFKQQRSGIHENFFIVYKFRSMVDKLGLNGELLFDAERLTRFGSFIRKASLDELPQLWNVLKGDMSLVGPRPLLTEYLPLYNNFQRRRFEVRPGITGWAQVCGRNAISWQQKFELDIWYVNHRSFRVDMWILWKTFVTIFKTKGINQSKHVTMKKFRGNKVDN